MKIETNDKGEIVLKEVFNGVILKSPSGCEIGICMRDSGFEIIHDESVMIETMDYFSGDDVNHLDEKAITKRKMIRIIQSDVNTVKGSDECNNPPVQSDKETEQLPKPEKGIRIMVDGKDVTKDYFVSSDYRLFINNSLTIEALKDIEYSKKSVKSLPEKESVSTLEVFDKNRDFNKEKERELIDFAIKELFNGKRVYVRHYYLQGNDKISNQILMNLIIDELKTKHGFHLSDLNHYSRDKFYIELKHPFT